VGSPIEYLLNLRRLKALHKKENNQEIT